MRGPTSPASTHTHRALAGATCHQAPLITTHSTTVLHRTDLKPTTASGLTRGPTRALSPTHGSVYLWSLPPLCPTGATTLVKAGGMSARALRPVSCQIGHPHIWSPGVTNLMDNFKILVTPVTILPVYWSPR